MNKKEYLTKLANRIRVSFYILLAVTIYEIWYWLNHGGGLSLVLILLAGAVTFFAYTLMQLFDDMKDRSE
jgi:hypothetical protein